MPYDLDFLLEDREKWLNSLPGYNTGLNKGGFSAQPLMSPDEYANQQTPDPGSGTLLDLVGSSLWGAVSGITWGGSEFVLPSKPWEEMNSMERTGWVLGEGGSLFAPWGAFGQMGKVSVCSRRLC
jgi:hypothetical protein